MPVPPRQGDQLRLQQQLAEERTMRVEQCEELRTTRDKENTEMTEETNSRRLELKQSAPARR